MAAALAVGHKCDIGGARYSLFKCHSLKCRVAQQAIEQHTDNLKHFQMVTALDNENWVR